MLAHVTNLALSPRGLDTGAGGIALLDPGETLLLDLADHPAHRAWEEAGEVAIAPVPDKEARAMRKRLVQLPFSRKREKVSRRSRDG